MAVEWVRRFARLHILLHKSPYPPHRDRHQWRVRVCPGCSARPIFPRLPFPSRGHPQPLGFGASAPAVVLQAAFANDVLSYAHPRVMRGLVVGNIKSQTPHGSQPNCSRSRVAWGNIKWHPKHQSREPLICCIVHVARASVFWARSPSNLPFRVVYGRTLDVSCFYPILPRYVGTATETHLSPPESPATSSISSCLKNLRGHGSNCARLAWSWPQRVQCDLSRHKCRTNASDLP